MVIFTKKFGTLDPHLPIVWDNVQKKPFFYTFPKSSANDAFGRNDWVIQELMIWYLALALSLIWFLCF